MEKLDLKLIDMRELYDELKSLDENAKALCSNLRKNSGGKCFSPKLSGFLHNLVQHSKKVFIEIFSIGIFVVQMY